MTGILPMVLALCIAGCSMPQAMPPADGPVADSAAFAALIVGRDLVEDGGDTLLRISGDGSWLERQRNHIAASGTWHWGNAGWCHQGRRDGALFGPVCAAVTRIGATLRLETPGEPARRFQVVP